MKTSILSRSLLAILALATTLSMLAGAEALFSPPAPPTEVVSLPPVTVTLHRDLALTTVSFASDLKEPMPVLAMDAGQRDPLDR
ncbi:MAG: hypothetical protein RL669_749 [Pseudomonadota bacterium]|jgi:hypothetical protein